jgi:hypothetical protein
MTLTKFPEHTDYKTIVAEPKPSKGRRRSEKAEHSFAHTPVTGGGRRNRLQSIKKNQKRYIMLTSAYNLGAI